MVRDHDLCPRQRLRRQVAGGYRGSRQQGASTRDHRDPGTRCGTRRGSGAAEGFGGASGRAARKAEAEFSKTTNARWRDSPKGVVSEQERESKKADYESSEARLYAANAQVALDKSKVEQYGALAEFKQVKAPFDGTVTERKIDVGNLVTAGSGSTTTPLYRMAQTDPVRIFVDVPQAAAGELQNAGVPAEIRATGAVGGVFQGKIARSAESINAQARTMRVEVDMPNLNHALVPGMYVSVAFRLQPRGLVEVPASALIFRASGTQVARVDASGKVEFQNVVIARDNGRMVELSSGVKPGDRLVLNISSQIAPGQVVSANGPADAGDAAKLSARSVEFASMKSPQGVLLVLVLAACAAGPSYRTPKPDLPPQFASSTAALVPGTPAVGGERRSCGVVEGAR